MNRGPKQLENARECLKLAVRAVPDSLAANYGLAITESLAKDTDAAITLLEKVASLRPHFYEARLDRALLYAEIGNRTKEEAELKNMLVEKPPLCIQREIFNKLMRIYDDLNRRADALAAEQSLISSEYQLQSVYPELVPDSLIAMSEASVGLRFEEQGKYSQAEESYRAADRNGRALGQSFLFEQAMGRSRSLRQFGDNSSAQLICSQWKASLQQLGPELDAFQWHGKELVFAKWELSCGNLVEGLQMLSRVATNDASTPESLDHFRAAAPYRALETFYRAHGKTRMAELAHESADRILEARTSTVLGRVLKDAAMLFDGSNIH
ncbi:MAG: hypothetical protein LAO76_02090 [Acidobacteriia bacterium]|nr:hypothetical protein [Terriglobia bacterium]